MPGIEVEVEIFCGGCGEGLCNQTTAGRTNGRGQPMFTVDPCQTCMDAAKDEGHTEGYNERAEEDEPDGQA